MKIVLIRGSWHAIWEPLSLGYLHAWTRDMDQIDSYLMFDGHFDSVEDTVNGCRDADIIGFSGTSSQMPWSLRVAAQIKDVNPHGKIVIGGYGPSVYPSKYVDDKRCDIVVVGEGEKPWRTIIEKEGVIETKVYFEPPIQNLDSIPFPDRKFMRFERCAAIAKKDEGRTVTSVWGNRGCLRRCVFCADGSAKTIYGVPLRERSPANIADEMEMIHDVHKVDFIKMADAEMNTRPGRMKEVCAEFIARNWDITFGGNLLANPISKEDAELMYKAGCREVWIGVESGSLEVHRRMGKGVTPELIRTAFRYCKDAGLKRRAYVLMGHKEETYQTIRETERLIDDIMPDTISLSYLAPYPGTFVFDPTEHGDLDFEKIDEYGSETNPWHPDAMTKKQVMAERQRLFEKYRGHLSTIIKKKIEAGVIQAPDDFKQQIGIIATDEIQLTDFDN